MAVNHALLPVTFSVGIACCALPGGNERLGPQVAKKKCWPVYLWQMRKMPTSCGIILKMQGNEHRPN